ncbi:Fibrocystin-L, partial [Entophlyctis luteolus]
MPVHMFGLQDYFQPTAVGTVSHSTGLLAKSLLNTFPLDEGGNPNGQMNFDENLCRYQISFGGSPANATVPIYANSYTPYRITINNGLTVFGCSSLNNCTCSPFANTTDCMFVPDATDRATIYFDPVANHSYQLPYRTVRFQLFLITHRQQQDNCNNPYYGINITVTGSFSDIPWSNKNSNGLMTWDPANCRYYLTYTGSPPNAAVPFVPYQNTSYKIYVNYGFQSIGCTPTSNCTCSATNDGYCIFTSDMNNTVTIFMDPSNGNTWQLPVVRPALPQQSPVPPVTQTPTSILVPQFPSVLADPALYPGPVNVQNHWSEVVVFSRPNITAVTPGNMQTIGCPHLASGLTPWNSTAAWSTQIVPTGTEASITVAPNQNVLIQNISFASSTVFGQIVIPESSSLIFADEPITFKTRGITVYGRLQAGAPTCRLLNYVSIVLYGKKTDQPLPTDPSVKGIYVTGNGQLDLHSQVFAPTWTRLATHAVPGATYIIVQDLVNWDVNQTIVITTTALKDSRDYSENDIVSIAWIEAAPHLGSNVCIIGLNSPLRFFHYGGTEYQAEVGLLSRRLGVRGSPDSDLTTTQASCKDAASFSSYPCGAPTGFGGHILINGTGVGRVTSAELAYMGQTNVMGRYPFHVHMAGLNGANSYILQAAIHSSFYRCLSIHGSNNVTVSEVVAFNITGSCFYLEDGVEENNVFSYNLGAH